MKIKANDFVFLQALKSDPFISMVDLAKALSITPITAKRRYLNLQERGIIRKPSAIYIPEQLGLRRVTVIAYVDKFSSIKILEEMCTIHPYTKYRSRALGGKFKMFLQFDVPIGCDKHLSTLFDTLVSLKIISGFDLFLSTGLRLRKFPDLARFDIESFKWNFSWEDWFHEYEKFEATLPSPNPLNVDISEFKESHFEILRLLTSDASLKQKDIQEKLALSRTESYRQYAYVKDHYIEKVRLMYDRNLLNLTNTYLAISTKLDNNAIARFYNSLNLNPPPFDLSLEVLEGNNIYMWVHMSASQAIDFAFTLWKALGNTKVNILNTSDMGSFMYWFYPENFDFANKKWKNSEEYIIHDPLRQLKEKFNL